MNAYELAKQLEERHAPYENDAANMLRQQADRIAELEKELNKHFAKGFQNGKIEGWKAHNFHYQTKPLSDEEIHELANEHLRTQNQDGRLVVLGLEDFARAIEERHGIK